MTSPVRAIKKEFSLCAYFYRGKDEIKCRKYLDIKVLGSVGERPDLIVVMLNPGSCGEGKEITFDELVPVAPDATLRRVQRFMEDKELTCVRILNLCDIQEKNSGLFFKKYTGHNASEYQTAFIFDDSRRKELLCLAPAGTPFIFAWGLDSRNKSMVDSANKCVVEMGYPVVNKDFRAFHPLTRPINGNPLWRELMSEAYELYLKNKK